MTRKLSKKDHNAVVNYTQALFKSIEHSSPLIAKKARNELYSYLESLEPSSPVNWRLWLRKPTSILLGLVAVLQAATLILIGIN